MAMITKKQRLILIEWLVDDDKFNFSQGEIDELERILIEGCTGYKNRTDQELINEYYARAPHDPLNINL